MKKILVALLFIASPALAQECASDDTSCSQSAAAKRDAWWKPYQVIKQQVPVLKQQLEQALSDPSKAQAAAGLHGQLVQVYQAWQDLNKARPAMARQVQGQVSELDALEKQIKERAAPSGRQGQSTSYLGRNGPKNKDQAALSGKAYKAQQDAAKKQARLDASRLKQARDPSAPLSRKEQRRLDREQKRLARARRYASLDGSAPPSPSGRKSRARDAQANGLPQMPDKPKKLVTGVKRFLYKLGDPPRDQSDKPVMQRKLNLPTVENMLFHAQREGYKAALAGKVDLNDLKQLKARQPQLEQALRARRPVGQILTLLDPEMAKKRLIPPLSSERDVATAAYWDKYFEAHHQMRLADQTSRSSVVASVPAAAPARVQTRVAARTASYNEDEDTGAYASVRPSRAPVARPAATTSDWSAGRARAAAKQENDEDEISETIAAKATPARVARAKSVDFASRRSKQAVLAEEETEDAAPRKAARAESAGNSMVSLPQLSASEADQAVAAIHKALASNPAGALLQGGLQAPGGHARLRPVLTGEEDPAAFLAGLGYTPKQRFAPTADQLQDPSFWSGMMSKVTMSNLWSSFTGR